MKKSLSLAIISFCVILSSGNSVTAAQITQSSFSSNATIESFEGLHPDPLATNQQLFFLPTPFTFSSGLKYIGRGGSGGSEPAISDSAVGLTGCYGSAIIGSQIPNGSAFLCGDIQIEAFSLVFEFTSPVTRVGLFIASTYFTSDNAFILKAYDINNNLLESATITNATLSTWKTNFLGIENSAGIHRISIYGGRGAGAVLDSVMFEGGRTPQSQISVSPTNLNTATGGVASGTNTIFVNLINHPSESTLAFTSALASNPCGEFNAQLQVVDNQNYTGTVFASPQNTSSDSASGIFDVSVCSQLVCAEKPPMVTVPPQSLIQVIIGEAQGQIEQAQIGVASAIRNRLSSPLLFCKDRNGAFESCGTYNDAIWSPGQFSSTTTSRFKNAIAWSTAENKNAYGKALRIGAEIFDGRQTVTLGTAIGFGSPGALPEPERTRQVNKVQDALQRCQRVSARTLRFNPRWYPLFNIDDQALVVDGIPIPVFVFVRERPANGCAVINYPFQ